MNENFLWPLGTALWIGILTSTSPCPLATNITALSFLSREIRSPLRACAGTAAYVVGRSLAYAALAYLLAIGLTTLSEMSFFLQLELGKYLGPLLIVLGTLLIFEFFPKISGLTFSQRTGERLRELGILGAFILGALFALAFCPVSAALFFGTLIPLSVANSSPLAMPVAYGIGTGLPVIVVSLLLVCGFNRVGAWFNRIELFEKIARRVTGVVFILAGAALVQGWL